MKSNYLVKTRSKSLKKKQFRVVDEPVYLQPDNVFEFSLDIDAHHTIDLTYYGELVEKVL